MIQPNIKLNNTVDVSYYSLVVAIAKRAREIANEAEIKGEILVEKPVDIAVDEFIHGKFRIIEPNECAGKGREEVTGSDTEAALEEAMLETEIDLQRDETTL